MSVYFAIAAGRPCRDRRPLRRTDVDHGSHCSPGEPECLRRPGSARTRHRSEIRGTAPGSGDLLATCPRGARSAGGPQRRESVPCHRHPARAAMRSPPSMRRATEDARAEYVPKFGTIKAGGSGNALASCGRSRVCRGDLSAERPRPARPTPDVRAGKVACTPAASPAGMYPLREASTTNTCDVWDGATPPRSAPTLSDLKGHILAALAA